MRRPLEVLPKVLFLPVSSAGSASPKFCFETFWHTLRLPHETFLPTRMVVRTKQYVSVDDRALLSMASCLGMDPTRDKDLLWIARSALEAPLPDGWEELEDEDGTRYFHERASGKTSWQLPSDDYYRQVARASLGLGQP